MTRPASIAFLFAITLTASQAAAQWNDGPLSAIQHNCWQGVYDPIPETLAYTYVGFNGNPLVGQVYSMRIAIAGLGCSGAYVLPEVKLPHDTHFAIDAGHPIRCYLGAFSGAGLVNDGSCPSAPSQAGITASGFVSFPPTRQPYWPLPPGKLLIIEFPVVSNVVLKGIGSSSDFLLGGAIFLDNSPGNPVPSYDVPPTSYTSGIPSDGAWQGVFVQPSGALTTGGTGTSTPTPAPLPAGSTDTRFAFTEPAVLNVEEQLDGTAHVTVSALVYNATCFSDATSNADRSVAIDLSRAEGTDDVTVINSVCFGQNLSDTTERLLCNVTFGNIRYGVDYTYFSFPQSPTVAYRNDGKYCAPTGSAPTASEHRLLRLEDPSEPVRYHVVTRIEGSGTVALTPESSCTSATDCAAAAFIPGASVTVTATANSGETFQHWLVDGTQATETGAYTFSALDADHAVVAVFSGTGGTGTGTGTGDGTGTGTGNGDGAIDGGGSTNDTSSGGCNEAGAPSLMLVVLGAAALTACRWWRFG